MFRTTSQENREPRTPAPFRSISTKKIDTLMDLLGAIRQTEPDGSHLAKMLGATVAHLAICLGEPPDKISIRDGLDARPALKAHLKEKGFRRNSIRSYLNYLSILIKRAKQLGWIESPPELVAAWQQIRELLRKAVGSRRIIDFAIAQGKSPAEFGDADLLEWEGRALESGLKFDYVRIVKGRFRSGICQSVLRSSVPRLASPADDAYGVPFSRLPETLRDEITAVLTWKTAEFSPGRPRRAKVRPICAFWLKRGFCRLFGNLQKVQGKAVSTLRELLSEECLTAFAAWCLNERGVNGRCVEIDLARICGLRHCPLFVSLNFSWLPRLMEQLPRRDQSEIREHKASKWIPHDLLRLIPAQIRRDAEREAVTAINRKARMFRDALILDWLATLPWRQRNLRELKVLPFASGGNLHKEEIPSNSTMARSGLVENLLKLDLHTKIWQFYFSRHETKTDRPVRGIVPRQLTGPLEDYLANYRGVLLNGHPDPDTLFINQRGRPFCRKGLRRIVGDLAMKYAGVRTHPHLLRDVLSVAYLRDHPRDFLTLSKILWHRDPGTTVKIYGQNFDESDGALAAEEWLDKRNNGSKD